LLDNFDDEDDDNDVAGRVIQDFPGLRGLPGRLVSQVDPQRKYNEVLKATKVLGA